MSLRSLFFIIVLSIVSNSVVGDERKKAEMDDIAASVLRGSSIKSISGDEELLMDRNLSQQLNELFIGSDKGCDTGAFAVYAYKNGTPGYVIVTTDDNLPGIVAFSEKEHFQVDKIPSPMLELLKQYSFSLRDNGDSMIMMSCARTNEEEKPEVTPLLGDIAFSQFAPYNDRCPMYNGERAVTGCLATAMAQIMAYYQYPYTMFGENIEYVTEKYSIPVSWDCSATRFDWDNILTTYDSGLAPDYTDPLQTTSQQYMTFTTMMLSIEHNHCIDITHLVSVAQNNISGELQLLLADSQGIFIRPTGKVSVIENLKPKAGWGGTFIKHSIPINIPDGTYRLYLGFRENTADSWSVIQRTVDETNVYDSEREEFYILVTKSGMYYYIENVPFACDYTALQADAVATLCAACGAASRMNYGTDGSSADNHNMGKGLIDYMDYDNKMYILQSGINTDGKWLEGLLQEELDHSRPVYCCTCLADGASHAIVIDGYRYVNDITYFHVNWGWNGDNNGYYLLDNMTTSSGAQYGFQYSLTMGIKPNDNNDIGYTFTAKSVSTTYENKTLVLTVDNLLNSTLTDFCGDIIVYAIDKDGAEYDLNTIEWDSWKSLSGYDKFVKTIVIGSELKEGYYQIVLRCKERGSMVERNVLTPLFPTVYVNGNSASVEHVEIDDIREKEKTMYDLLGRKLQGGYPMNSVVISKGLKYVLTH